MPFRAEVNETHFVGLVQRFRGEVGLKLPTDRLRMIGKGGFEGRADFEIAPVRRPVLLLFVCHASDGEVRRML